MEKSKEMKPGILFKHSLVGLFFGCIVLVSFGSTGFKEVAGPVLVVKLQNVRSSQGDIRLAVFDQEEGFPGDRKKAV